MWKHWFGVVELEELLMAHSSSFVLLFPILLACVRLVSTYFVESFAVPIHFEQGRSRENKCERIFVNKALNIIFVFMMRTRRNVERVIHSVLYWIIFLNDLFYKSRFQSTVTDPYCIEQSFSMTYHLIWYFINGDSNQRWQIILQLLPMDVSLFGC